MSKPSFADTVEQFIHGSMTNAVTQRLEKAVTNDDEVARSLVAQRTVHQLLQLASESEAQQALFVDSCVDKFHDQFNFEVKNTKPAFDDHKKWRVATGVIAVATCIGFVSVGTWLLIAGTSKEKVSLTAVSANSIDSTATEQQDNLQNANSITTNDIPTDSLGTESEEGLNGNFPTHRIDSNANSHVPRIVERNDPPEKAIEIAKSDASESESKQPFGRLISNRNAVWSDDSPDDLQPGRFQLVRGSARLKFDNGVQVRLSAPAEFSIADQDTLKVSKGELLVEIPRKNQTFACLLGNQKFANPSNATFFLRAKSDSLWESLVMQGSMELTNTAQTSSPIELAKNGLNQVVVASQEETSNAPSTLIARGRNQFLGQCFQAGDTVTLNDADNFQHFLNRVVMNEDIGWERFAENSRMFNASIQAEGMHVSPPKFRELLSAHLRNHNIGKNNSIQRDKNAKSTTNFHGSLNINGVEQHFDSFEEYNRAKQLMFDQGNLGGVSPSRPPQQLPGQQVFEVGNQKIGFSTMDVFKRSRRKMNQ